MLPAHSPLPDDGSAVIVDVEGRCSEPSTPVAPSSSVVVAATPLSPLLRVAGGALPPQTTAQNLSIPAPAQTVRAVSPAQGLSVRVPSAALPPQPQAHAAAQPARTAAAAHQHRPPPQAQRTQPQQQSRNSHVRSATPPLIIGASVSAVAATAAPRTAVSAQAASVATSKQQLPPRKNSAPVISNATAPRAADGHSNGLAAAAPATAPKSQAPSRRNSSIESALHLDFGITSTFFHACTDYHPLLAKRTEYFSPDLSTELPGAVGSISTVAARPRSNSLFGPLVRDVISVVVPCFTESGRSLQKTLYDLYLMQEHMHANKTWFQFHVCIILDGWSHAPPSLRAYIQQLFESEDEAEAVKWSTLQEEIKNAEDLEPSTEAAGNSDDSSSSDDDDTSDALLPESDRKIKAASLGSAVKFKHETASAPKASATSTKSHTTAKNTMTPGSALGSDSFYFPESVSSGSAFGTTGSTTASSSSSKRATWEKYISNWSADSELNPPTQPETLIVQKWLTSADGLTRSIKALPLFPGLRDDEMMGLEGHDSVPSDPEELRRKQNASLKMTVLIKRDNRRKHNSHEWFLTAFAPVYTTRLHASSTSATGVQLVFMTDAGTRFHRNCVLSLVQHALQTPTTVACSGRQRVMTHAMQNEGEPPTDKWSINFLRSQLYRCAQGFEYEASISAFNGAFDCVGMLPVLPGPCGLFRLDLIFREGDAVAQDKARQAEHVRIQGGKLRAIHVAENRALMELHKYVWTSLTVQKQMHRATWAAYCKRQQNQQSLVRTTATGGFLEPFTPFEKAEAQFKFVELKTQLFTLTNELQRNQLLLITVLLRLDADSVCLHGLPQMLSQESIVWTRMQSLLVLVKQLHELESTSYSSMAAEGSMTMLASKMPALGDWDRQMHMQLEQLRRLLTQQIYQLKEYLVHIQKADGGLLSVIRSELSMDAADLDHLLETRALQSLASARDPIDFYFKVVNQIPNEVDLITANLMLAEDRILSYAVVLMAPVPVHTDFVPDALFFFEAETEAENALQQSRRWTNGTVAGFLWLFCSGIRFKQRRYLVYLLVLAQLIMYCIVGLSPALWTIGLHYSLTLWFEDQPSKYGDWLVFLYLGLYALFVILHSDPTPGKKRLHAWLFHILTIVNMMVATLPIAALVPEFMRQTSRTQSYGCQDQNGWLKVGGMSLQCWILGGAVVGTLVMPFILAILYDIYSLLPACNKRPVSRRSRQCPYGLSWMWGGSGWGSVTYEMITGAVWFYLFLPTKVSIYPCYAFSRTWELTWGNKPSETLYSLTSHKDARALESTKKRMLQLSQVISYALLLGNIFLFMLVSELGARSGVLVVLTVFILLWALLQMGVSLLWILSRMLLAPMVKAVRIVGEWMDIVRQRPEPAGGYQNLRSGHAGPMARRGSNPAAAVVAGAGATTAIARPPSKQGTPQFGHQRAPSNGLRQSYGQLDPAVTNLSSGRPHNSGISGGNHMSGAPLPPPALQSNKATPPANSRSLLHSNDRAGHYQALE